MSDGAGVPTFAGIPVISPSSHPNIDIDILRKRNEKTFKTSTNKKSVSVTQQSVLPLEVSSYSSLCCLDVSVRRRKVCYIPALAASGRVCPTAACAAFGRFCPIQPVLPLDVSIL